MIKFIGIMAMSKNGVIGKDGKLPWGHIVEDMAFFQTVTRGTIVVMGSKTFRDCGALPGRINVVLTNNPKEFKGIDSVYPLPSLGGLFNFVREQNLTDCKEVYIIGGSQIYNAMLPLLSSFFVTRIERDYEGDAFAPSLCTSYCDTAKPFNVLHSTDGFGNPVQLSFFRIPREFIHLH